MNDLITKYYVQATMKIEEFKQDQRGVTAIEYGLIAVAVGTGISVAVLALGDNISAAFEALSTLLTPAA